MLSLVVPSLSVLALFAGAPATSDDRAAEALRILVVAPGADDARVEQIYGGLRAAGLQPVGLEEREGVDRPTAIAPRRPTRDDARALVQEARALFRALDLDGARIAAAAALDEAVALERVDDAKDVIADALLLRASIAQQAGDDDVARKSLLLLVRIDPALTELHPGLYPPSLVDAFAAARLEEEQRPLASLIVRPRVAAFLPARVLVDGVEAPAVLREGPHLVSVRVEGAVPFSRIVELDADAPLVLEPFLAPADAGARRAALVGRARVAEDDAARMHALGPLAALSAARAVVLVTNGGPGHPALATSFVAGRGVRPLPVAADASGRTIGRAMLAVLQAPPSRGDDAPAPDDATGWLVAAGAAGLVLTAGAVAIAVWALLPAEPPPPPPLPVYGDCCVD